MVHIVIAYLMFPVIRKLFYEIDWQTVVLLKRINHMAILFIDNKRKYHSLEPQ